MLRVIGMGTNSKIVVEMDSRDWEMLRSVEGVDYSARRPEAGSVCSTTKLEDTFNDFEQATKLKDDISRIMNRLSAISARIRIIDQQKDKNNS